MMSSPAKTVEFCEDRRVLAQTNHVPQRKGNYIGTTIKCGTPQAYIFLSYGRSWTPRNPLFRTLVECNVKMCCEHVRPGQLVYKGVLQAWVNLNC